MISTRSRSSLFALILVTIAGLVAIDPSVARAETPWSPDQRPATLVGCAKDGALAIDGVRWGFDNPADHRHTSRWRTVNVDPRAVTDVVFVIKPFAPEWLAAHALLCFRFDPRKPVTTSSGETTTGLVLSVEAHLHEGQPFSLLGGFAGQFGIVYQLSSWEDYVARSSIADQSLLPYVLALDPDQKRRLLERAMEEAVRSRPGELYNTTRRSCTTELVDLLNDVLPEKQRLRQYLIPGVLKDPATSLPRTMDRLLRSHGLIREALPVIEPAAKPL